MSHSTIVNSSAIACLLVQKIKAASRRETGDSVAVEEPLEIRLQNGPAGRRTEQGISVTMRTPGNDPELATGFLFTEGIIADASAIAGIEQIDPASNTIRIDLHERVLPDLGRLQRHFYTSSSCGVCGKSSIDTLKTV